MPCTRLPTTGSVAPTAPTTMPVLPRPPKRPALRARITSPAAPITTSSSASVNNAPTTPVYLIGLDAHSSPMQPRGMDAMMRAETTNRTPPSMAESPLHRTVLEEAATLLLPRNVHCERIVTSGEVPRITRMDDLGLPVADLLCTDGVHQGHGGHPLGWSHPPAG